jgi:hypothetical protein
LSVSCDLDDFLLISRFYSLLLTLLQHDPDREYTWIWQLKCHFSKFVWIRGLKAKSADKAADELIKWLNDNKYIVILACDNEGEFKERVNEVCKKREIKVVRGQARHPQSQGSIEVANRIFKKRLRAAGRYRYSIIDAIITFDRLGN